MASLGCIYQAMGRTQTLFRIALVQMASVAVGAAIGLPWAATGVAVGVTAALCASAVLPIRVAMTLMHATASDMRDTLGAFVVAGSAQAAAMIITHIVLGDRTGPLAALVVAFGAGGATYVAIGRLVDRRFLMKLQGGPWVSEGTR